MNENKRVTKYGNKVEARNILPKVYHHLLSDRGPDRGRIMTRNTEMTEANIWWVIVT